MKKFFSDLKFWWRRTKSKFINTTSRGFQKNKDLFDFIFGFVSVITAIAALVLALKDKSQQQQINQLKGIAVKISQQNEVANTQTAQLIAIAQSSHLQDSLSTQMLTHLNKQANLSYQQLTLTKKADSSSTLSQTLQSQVDLFALRESFDNLMDVNKTVAGIYNLSRVSIQQRNDILENVRSQLEKGLKNRLVLTNEKIRFFWLTYYTILRQDEINLKYYTPSSTGAFKDSVEFLQTCTAIMSEHMSFINSVLKELNLLENEYISKLSSIINDSTVQRKPILKKGK